jgi:SAM-dependent methyltransferase
MWRAQALEGSALRAVADRLAARLDAGATVLDVGCGTGGMSAALAGALRNRGGGRLVLVDAVPELLEVAGGAASQAGGTQVEVRTVRADAASEEMLDVVPAADLVWASRVLHHLPDQRRGAELLVEILAPGGWLALAEGGLERHCLPWDVGVGRPGLENRLLAARARWFEGMRAGIPGSVRLPVGWTRVLAELGLASVTSFSYLVEHPAPPSAAVREAVVDWLAWIAEAAADHIGADDRDAVGRLLDPEDPAWVGARDDVYLLQADTVYLGRAEPETA